MTYLNQPWFNRKIINTIAMATGAVHSETLTVIGRASKQPQKIPVTPVDVDGVKYLVSTRGESQWVKNCLHPHPAIILAFQVIRHADDRHGHVNTSMLRGVTRPSTSACPIQRLAR
jgi:hypothetical protein